ncbi:MAG: hypothetical protein SFW64_00940 [Alphaproteobacteria bacterium]|nr:hypothetical protein [Alphaproteobacteria bacterium]
MSTDKKQADDVKVEKAVTAVTWAVLGAMAMVGGPFTAYALLGMAGHGLVLATESKKK